MDEGNAIAQKRPHSRANGVFGGCLLTAFGMMRLTVNLRQMQNMKLFAYCLSCNNKKTFDFIIRVCIIESGYFIMETIMSIITLAYIDPGAASMIVAGIVGAVVYCFDWFKTTFKRIFYAVTGKKIKSEEQEESSNVEHNEPK